MLSLSLLLSFHFSNYFRLPHALARPGGESLAVTVICSYIYYCCVPETEEPPFPALPLVVWQ